MKIDKIVPDISAIMTGIISRAITMEELRLKSVIVHEYALSYLEHLAALDDSAGITGLNELKNLRTMLGDNFRVSGKKPTLHESGKLTPIVIDSHLRTLAHDESATLFALNSVQAGAAEAMGIPVIRAKKKRLSPLKIESFFDETTMSVHLREGTFPMAKKGNPGSWKYAAVTEDVLDRETIKSISDEIIETARTSSSSFLEFEKTGSTIVQMGTHRIVITRPPLSDGWEITAVRPISELELYDYRITESLAKRLSGKADGILIAGSPGAGKTTFASALAKHFVKTGKIVKTIEAPRDLNLPETITQYAISHSATGELHDILLLSRPDYTIFDEMRNTDDFRLFSDLRLSGIGMLGVIHATTPIDAIHRFVGRVELGIIPHIIDTVIFISAGTIENILGLRISVKVPHGMSEADLARPVVEIFDFSSGKVEYELYTFGEQTIVIPVTTEKSLDSPAKNLAARQLQNIIGQYVDTARVDMRGEHKAIISVPEKDIPSIIGPKGKIISKIEKIAGISIEVKGIPDDNKQDTIPYDIFERGNSIVLVTGCPGIKVEAAIDNKFLFTSMTSKKGEIKVSMESEQGKLLAKAITLKSHIELKKVL